MQQNIVQGIDNLLQIVKACGSKRLFVVTGSRSYASLNFREIIDSLDIEKVFFTDFTPNPLYEHVCEGVDLFESEHCDSILAIGGGSPIDVAKCIKVSVLADAGKLAIIPPLVNARVKIDGRKIPLIAIPTTAGTGSESTHNAVMYYEGSKQTVTNDRVLPDYAILEPSVLKTLTPYQKKCTMMDALCQGIEAWWSVNSTEESYEYSRKTIELIMQNWRAYIFDNDSVAAEKIMLAANFGGRAINITQTTAAHAMSYKITSLYKLPHGHAVAICLPEIWEYMLENTDKCFDARGAEYLNDVFTCISRSMGVATPTEAILLFRQMMKDMELANPVAVQRENELAVLSSSVNPIRLKNNPVSLDFETIMDLYKIVVR